MNKAKASQIWKGSGGYLNITSPLELKKSLYKRSVDGAPTPPHSLALAVEDSAFHLWAFYSIPRQLLLLDISYFQQTKSIPVISTHKSQLDPLEQHWINLIPDLKQEYLSCRN